MKITIEIDMDDTDRTEAVARRVANVASYAAAYVSTCVVKAGRMEVHETGVFGLVYKDANNVKITIDRSV